MPGDEKGARYAVHGQHWRGLHGIWDIQEPGVERQSTFARPRAHMLACLWLAAVQSLWLRVGHPGWAFFLIVYQSTGPVHQSVLSHTQFSLSKTRPRIHKYLFSPPSGCLSFFLFLSFLLHPTTSRHSFPTLLQRYPTLFDTLFLHTVTILFPP